ncbi:unnamed protein product [Brassica oleracea var. botrytis]|uniref:Uncharacterized protein n=2 Tax=Brassica TaxID=3705 RepID=A0A3P6BT00_BRAOL|nr:unnamed protein product [Brassica napus]VDD08883.1 unnamed protein product [Brassica oleracea]
MKSPIHLFRVYTLSNIVVFLAIFMVMKKIEFLVNDINCTVKVVVSNPSVLDYSLEERTILRCKLIKDIMSKGLLGTELPSTKTVLDKAS